MEALLTKRSVFESITDIYYENEPALPSIGIMLLVPGLSAQAVSHWETDFDKAQDLAAKTEKLCCWTLRFRLVRLVYPFEGRGL